MSNIYKRATKKKLRFKTNRGTLMAEDLFDLDLDNLDSMAVKLSKTITDQGEGSFRRKKTAPKTLTDDKLRLDILKDVIETREAEIDRAEAAEATRTQNQLLKNLIQEKKLEDLKGKSTEELEAMLDDIRHPPTSTSVPF